MRAAVVAVGSELLGSDRAETNSLRLAAMLHRYGVELAAKSVASDDLEEISHQIESAIRRHDLVIVSGGLGPTADDRTREGVAAALGRSLERSAELVEQLRERFARRGFRMPSNNLRQADLVAGAEPLNNPLGSAPGQRLVAGECTLFLLPGVPSELEAMAGAQIEPWLAERSGESRIEQGCLKVACMAESALDERIEPFYQRYGADAVTILASKGDLTLLVGTAGKEAERRAALDERLGVLRDLLGASVYGDSVGDQLESVVGAELRRAEATVVTAESCTGGLVAERLTRVPGSSAYFLGGLLAYSNELKVQLMGVAPETIERCGAVSEEVVRAMASGARERLEADYSVAVSGIAGPGGGSDEKPVGTVYLAVDSSSGSVAQRRLQLPGDRTTVRWLASQYALEMIRRTLLDLPMPPGALDFERTER